MHACLVPGPWNFPYVRVSLTCPYLCPTPPSIHQQQGDPVSWNVYKTSPGWRLRSSQVRDLLKKNKNYKTQTVAAMHSRLEVAYINCLMFPTSVEACRVMLGFLSLCQRLQVEGDDALLAWAGTTGETAPPLYTPVLVYIHLYTFLRQARLLTTSPAQSTRTETLLMGSRLYRPRGAREAVPHRQNMVARLFQSWVAKS
jgi:hypothetical protein